MIKRIYVERKPGHDIEAQCLYRDLKENLGIGGIKKLRLLKRFDVEGITEEEYLLAKNTVFSQSQVDITYDEKLLLIIAGILKWNFCLVSMINRQIFQRSACKF